MNEFVLMKFNMFEIILLNQQNSKHNSYLIANSVMFLLVYLRAVIRPKLKFPYRTSYT